MNQKVGKRVKARDINFAIYGKKDFIVVVVVDIYVIVYNNFAKSVSYFLIVKKSQGGSTGYTNILVEE